MKINNKYIYNYIFFVLLLLTIIAFILTRLYNNIENFVTSSTEPVTTSSVSVSSSTEPVSSSSVPISSSTEPVSSSSVSVSSSTEPVTTSTTEPINIIFKFKEYFKLI
jgi:cytoskeletal protein RodZ